MAMNTTSRTLVNTTSDSLAKEDSDESTIGIITDALETLNTTSPKLLSTNLVTQRTTEASSTRIKTPDSLDLTTTEISTISNNIRE